MIKRGWKVVSWFQRRETTGRLVTQYQSASAPMHGVTSYSFGRWSERPGLPEFYGPLTVFKTRADARHFHRSFKGANVKFRIFKCLYIPSKDHMLWAPSAIFKSERTYRTSLPVGTRFAESVMLLSRRG